MGGGAVHSEWEGIPPGCEPRPASESHVRRISRRLLVAAWTLASLGAPTVRTIQRTWRIRARSTAMHSIGPGCRNLCFGLRPTALATHDPGGFLEGVHQCDSSQCASSPTAPQMAPRPAACCVRARWSVHNDQPMNWSATIFATTRLSTSTNTDPATAPTAATIPRCMTLMCCMINPSDR
jgi:hypothetical protein